MIKHILISTCLLITTLIAEPDTSIFNVKDVNISNDTLFYRQNNFLRYKFNGIKLGDNKIYSIELPNLVLSKNKSKLEGDISYE